MATDRKRDPSAYLASDLPYLGRAGSIACLLLVISPIPAAGQGFGTTEAQMTARLCFFTLLAVCTIVTTLCWKYLNPARLHTKAVIAAMIAQAVSSAMYSASIFSEMSTAPTAFSNYMNFLSLIMQPLAIPLLEMAWGEAYAKLSMAKVTRYTVVSLALAVFVLVLIYMLPNPVSALVIFALPFSSLLLIKSLHREPYASYKKPSKSIKSGQPSWRFLLGALCTLVANNIMFGAAEVNDYLTWDAILRGSIIAVILIAVTATIKSFDLKKTIIGLTIAIAAVNISSGLFMNASDSMIALIQEIQHHVGPCVELALMTSIWLIMIEISQATKVSPLFTVGMGFSIVNLGKAIGAALGMLIPLDSILFAFISLALFVPAVYLLASSAQPAAVPLDSKLILNEKLDRLTNNYSLTKREREVLELWAARYKLEYVAKELFISKNTAKTHVTHIYQKTGTANRDQLLLLLERQ